MEYAKKYPDKIRLFLNSRKNNIAINGKPSGLFNSLYTNFAIQSKYIALCESDDIWQDEYSLQKRIDFMEANESCSFCFHNAINQYYSGNELKEHFRSHMVNLNQSKKIGLKDVYTLTPTATLLYRNHLIDVLLVGQERIICGDLLLRHKLLLHGYGMYLHDIKPSIRTIHKNGSFSQLSKQHQASYAMAANEYVYEYLLQKGVNATHVLAKMQLRKMSVSLRRSLNKKHVNRELFHQGFKTTKLAIVYPVAFLNILFKRFTFRFEKTI